MRDVLFMAADDVAARGFTEGDPVVVRSEHGELRARVHVSPLRPGNVQVFFPEGNVLLVGGKRDPESGVPDYNAVVTIEHRVNPEALLEIFDHAFDAQHACAAAVVVERASRANRSQRSVPPRHRRRRGDPADPPRCRHSGAQRRVGVDRARRRRDHGRARPGRRVHELRAQHPVLVDIAVRTRRRGHARRLCRERRDGVRYTAIRGQGAWVDGRELQPSATTALDRSVIAITGLPPRRIRWRQFRALGSSALSLCDVAAGNVDGFLDCLPDQHRPWDYLGGLLVCSRSRRGGRGCARPRPRDRRGRRSPPPGRCRDA